MPETRYAKSGDVHIAYQVIGQGSLDLVFVPGWISHVELAWEFPPLASFLRRLGSFVRLILFDKRGTGMSDQVPLADLPTLEQRMDDVRAVMDAVGSKRAALLGLSEGGPMILLFGATYPTRTRALILLSSFACLRWEADYPIGIPSDTFERMLERIEQGWGTGVLLSALAPPVAGNQDIREYWARYQRLAASPGTAVRLLRLAYETDARGILQAIRVPALVVHRVGDRFIPVSHARFLANSLHGAKYVELPGEEHLPHLGDVDSVLGEIQEFLTGTREPGEAERVLTTVLFVDLVRSTEMVAAMGDRAWRGVVEQYYGLMREALRQFRGREIDTAGDGLFASFDGPARAVRCATNIVNSVRGLGLNARAGCHTGEVEVIGRKFGGIGVHIGARVASLAGPGEVLLTHTVRDLVAGSGLPFEDRGTHALKGVPGEWRLYGVMQEPVA